MLDISQSDRDLFTTEGYMILPAVIPRDMLDLLREECSYFIGYFDAMIDNGSIASGALSRRGSRYFINDFYRYSDRLYQFIFSDLMADIIRATLGPDAVLFHEQWVVKGPEQGMKFSWHQDSGYVKYVDKYTDHDPYLTCWCALDAVNEENGTVYLLPHSSVGTKGKIIDHEQDPVTNDLIGYSGKEKGIAIDVPAGSIVCFSSYNLHSSGANRSNAMRRVYLPQYAKAPIENSQTGERMNLAVPFLKNGKNIYARSSDSGEAWGGRDWPQHLDVGDVT